MADDLRPDGGYLFTAPDIAAIAETHRQHPALATSKYCWCPKCHYHAGTYGLSQDKVTCQKCGHDSGILGVFYTPEEISAFRCQWIALEKAA